MKLKLCSLALLLAMSAIAQTAFTISGSISDEALSSLNSVTQTLRATNISVSPTTGAAVALNATSVTLSSTTGIAVDMGLLIDNEAMRITSITSATVVAVTRGTLGTANATHLISSTATVLAYGALAPFIKSLVIADVRQIMMRNPGPAVTAAQAAITTATAGAVN